MAWHKHSGTVKQRGSPSASPGLPYEAGLSLLMENFASLFKKNKRMNLSFPRTHSLPVGSGQEVHPFAFHKVRALLAAPGAPGARCSVVSQPELTALCPDGSRPPALPQSQEKLCREVSQGCGQPAPSQPSICRGCEQQRQWGLMAGTRGARGSRSACVWQTFPGFCFSF